MLTGPTNTSSIICCMIRLANGYQSLCPVKEKTLKNSEALI
jgi:hypothetical protein